MTGIDKDKYWDQGQLKGVRGRQKVKVSRYCKLVRHQKTTIPVTNTSGYSSGYEGLFGSNVDLVCATSVADIICPTGCDVLAGGGELH